MGSQSETWNARFAAFQGLHLLGAILSVPVLITGTFWMIFGGVTGTPPRWTYCSKYVSDPIVYKSAADVSSAANGVFWAYFLCWWLSFIPLICDIGSAEDGDFESGKVGIMISSWLRFLIAGITSLTAFFYRQAVLNANCTAETSNPDTGMPLCRNHAQLLRAVWIVPGTMFALSILPCTVMVFMLLWKICFRIYKGVAYCCGAIQETISSMSKARKQNDLEKGQYDTVERLSIEGRQSLSSAPTIAAESEDEDEDDKDKL